MRKLKWVGLAVVAACAMSVLVAASASASMFSSTEAGKLTAKVLEKQTFNTEAGAVTCTALTLLAGQVPLLSESIHVTIDYQTCKAFGLAAVISKALYLFLANGHVHIQEPITVNGGAGQCIVLVPAQGVLTVDYSNAGKSVIITPLVKGILYTTEGPACAKKGEFSNGTYEGKSLVGLASGVGTVKWEA